MGYGTEEGSPPRGRDHSLHWGALQCQRWAGISAGQASSLPWRDLRSRGGERRATLGSPCKEGQDTSSARAVSSSQGQRASKPKLRLCIWPMRCRQSTGLCRPRRVSTVPQRASITQRLPATETHREKLEIQAPGDTVKGSQCLAPERFQGCGNSHMEPVVPAPGTQRACVRHHQATTNGWQRRCLGPSAAAPHQ